MTGSDPKGDLGARIRAAREQHAPERNVAAEKYNQLTLAWRMTLELVVGTGLGFGIGWGLDSLFGSEPLFMAIFGTLGFVAGVKTVMATAKEVGRRSEQSAAAEDGAPVDPDRPANSDERR